MIATTIEQSKRLIKVGIDTGSADMHWRYIEPIQERKYGLVYLHMGNVEWNDWDDWDGFNFPAWSLSALWDIIPPAFRDVVFNSMRTIDKDSENLIEIAVQFIEETWIKK